MKKIISIVLLLGVGVVAGMLLDMNWQSPKHETAMQHALKHAQPGYVCPMHSQIVSDEQGSCPICGMDLVEIKNTVDHDADDPHPVVRVSSSMINNMGVRVTQVVRKKLVRQIETPGFIQQIRKDRYSRYNAPAKGTVSKFYFSRGQWLAEGDPLVDIELDDLVLVQDKHLELRALEKQEHQQLANEAGATESDVAPDSKPVIAEPEIEITADTVAEVEEAEATKLTSDKTRLLMKAAGMTDQQIEALEETATTSPTITLYAKHAGEVKELRTAVGKHVKANGLLFTLGGLMRVSVLANAFQRDASWVKPGQDVDIILPHDDSRIWKGKVSSGAVSINTTSQNIGIELTFNAPDSVVKSGMYVVGHIYGQVREDALAIPREAVIYSRQNKRVIVALGQGRFKPVLIKTGISNDTEVEIIDGLEEGDTVVVSAQFLIDSESSLQASYRRMTGVE